MGCEASNGLGWEKKRLACVRVSPDDLAIVRGPLCLLLVAAFYEMEATDYLLAPPQPYNSVLYIIILLFKKENGGCPDKFLRGGGQQEVVLRKLPSRKEKKSLRLRNESVM